MIPSTVISKTKNAFVVAEGEGGMNGMSSRSQKYNLHKKNIFTLENLAQCKVMETAVKPEDK